MKAKRTPAPELASIVEAAAKRPAKAAAPAEAATPAPTPPPAKNMQLNFSCSPGLVYLVNEHAVKEGGIRAFIARVLKEAGYPVPDEDLVAGRAISRRMRPEA